MIRDKEDSLEVGRKYKGDRCVVYDMGHGKIDPKTGKYVTAPSKMFRHERFDMHNNGWFYEGVKNRMYGELISKHLRDAGVVVRYPHHNWKDTPLSDRINFTNFIHTNIQKCMFVSQHSNATSGHNARGYSVWTSKGQTTSDVLAEKLMLKYQTTFVNVDNTRRIRTLTDARRDGDLDYEANFRVLAETYCPAVLIENLFFDEIHDALLLMNKQYMIQYCKMEANWIIDCLEYLDEKDNK